MSRRRAYGFPLSLTSQFYFCGLPLRLDTYADCQFSCDYCFAAARGGNRSATGIRAADSDALLRRLRRARVNASTAVGELFGERQTIHFGGMSDPLPPVERRMGVSLAALRDLAADDYPVVLSTKSSLVAEDSYAATLLRPNALVQVSFSVVDDKLSSAIDRGAPSTSERVDTLARLNSYGVKTAARLQPIFPGYEDEALGFVARLAAAGVSHIGFEFLKIPLEPWPGIDRLSRALGYDVRRYFRAADAHRVGREWLLPVEQRLAFAMRAREETHRLGISFGAADTDLLPLSDSTACCSGADRLLPNSTTFEYNYLGAVRRADSDGQMRLSSLGSVWRPHSSISSMINSRSRIPATGGIGQAVSAYVELNWNGRKNGCAPDMFFGVTGTDQREADGSVVYQISGRLQSWMSEAW